MKQITYVIKDELGIHARPAGLLVKQAASFPCTIKIGKDGKEVDAKRLLGLMGLCVKCGNEITVTCDGEGEEEAIASMQAFLEENL